MSGRSNRGQNGCGGKRRRSLSSPDADDGVSELFAQHYTELKRIAHSRLYNANLRSPMATQSLLHESYLKLASINGDGRFSVTAATFAYSSRVMRNIIVDTVREVCADRRGGGAADLDAQYRNRRVLPGQHRCQRLDEALEALQRIDPDLATLVEMRFFGGSPSRKSPVRSAF